MFPTSYAKLLDINLTKSFHITAVGKVPADTVRRIATSMRSE